MARVLFVTTRLPFPPREGHQLRSWQLLRAAAADHEVTLLSLRRPEDPAALPAPAASILSAVETVDLPALGHPLQLMKAAWQWLGSDRPLLDIRYLDGRLRRAFRRRAKDCDLVHVDMLALAGLLGELPPGIPGVLNEHNVESALLRSRLAAAGGLGQRSLLRARMARLERFEAAACRQASRVLACSRADAAQLRLLAPGSRISVVANGVDCAGFAPEFRAPTDPESLLFVGHMGWFPNRDGIDWFCAQILPLLAGRDRLQVNVIGRLDGVTGLGHSRSQLRFHGFVDDLGAWLRRSAVFIVPLRHGSGTRLKVLEAMAMGKAIVSTAKGVEGIDLVDGHNVLIADTPRAFAAAIERLLDDPAARTRLGRAARQLAVDRYDWPAIAGSLQAVYRQLLARHRPGRCAPPAAAASTAR